MVLDHCGSDDGANAVTTDAVMARARKMVRAAIMVNELNSTCLLFLGLGGLVLGVGLCRRR